MRIRPTGVAAVRLSAAQKSGLAGNASPRGRFKG
jgi:hypothetical protein